MIENEQDFLDYFEAETLGDAAVAAEEQLQLDYDVHISGDEVLGEPGVEVQAYKSGFGLPFPFDIEEFWSSIRDIDDLYEAEMSYGAAAWNIEKIEGFEVELTISYEVDPERLEPSDDRRTLSCGLVVQVPRRYPYDDPISNVPTVADWISTRFEPNYPGFEVVVKDDHGDPCDPSTRISTLRKAQGVKKRRRTSGPDD